MRVQQQEGYALLVLVVFLLSIGGGFLSYMPSLSVATPAGFQFSKKNQHAVIAARQSLLSYAALYPYLYGPTGSGPGHLPCPDTDTQDGSARSPVVGVRRDGPNPPCSNPFFSMGKLPRHTVLPGNRYLFHAEPYQRFDYVVSGSFINNPINRILNLSNLNQFGSQPVSMLSVVAADGTRTEARVSISSHALAVSVAPAVSLWLTQRVNALVERYCGPPHSPEGVTASQPLAIQDETVNCRNLFDEPLESCPVDRLLVLLLDQPLVQEGESCLTNGLAEYTLEGVPANRHWFLRNQWHLSVSVESTDDCSQLFILVMPCRLEVVSSSRPSLGQAGGAEAQIDQVSLSLQWALSL